MKSHIMPLQKSCVYGPLTSRRFGRSLGINLLSVDAKICNFNCIYCQYGWTQKLKMSQCEFPEASVLIDEISERFEQLSVSKEKIDRITFSGNGEPTLHPKFEMIAFEVRHLRNQYLPHAKLGILSNASQVYKESIREALSLFDECSLKLDAGDELTFSMINNPVHKCGCWELTVEGLKRIPGLILQSLFLSYPVNNAEGFRFLAWLELVKEIKPQAVHLYSLDRNPACSDAKPVSRAELLKLADRVRSEAKVPAEVF